MLNEKLEKAINIGSKESVLYTISCLLCGTNSLVSLQHLVFSKFGRHMSDSENLILLFDMLGFVKFQNDKIITTKYFIDLYQSKSPEEILIIFSKKLIDFLVDNRVIQLNKVRYDVVNDNYFLPNSSFKIRYAVYRNLLLALKVLILRGKSYLLSDLLLASIKKKNRIKSVSLESLKQILEANEKIGEEGENFVIKYEEQRLGFSNSEKIKHISLVDVSAGFDIASFNNPEDYEYTRFIEVKTYIGDVHFHWSANEINRAYLFGEHYFLYLVDYEKINKPDYKPDIICNPYLNVYKSEVWSKKVDSYYITRKTDEYKLNIVEDNEE